MAFISLCQLRDHAAEHEFGGGVKGIYKVSVEEIQRRIRFGVQKVKIDTEIRRTMTGVMRHPHGVRDGRFAVRAAQGVDFGDEGGAFGLQGAIRSVWNRRSRRSDRVAGAGGACAAILVKCTEVAA